MFSHRYVRFAGHVLFGLTLAVIFALVFGWVVMLAWNEVVPAVTGLPAITFVQAVAGLVLVRLLTGRMVHPHGGRRRWRRHGHRHGHAFGCGRARRHGGDLYAVWWEREGEAAFKAFAARHLGEGAEPGAHGG